MKKNISKLGIVISTLFLPVFAFAQSSITLKSIACDTLGYAGIILILIISLSVVVFVWNVYRYFIVSDPSNKKEAGLYVLYSVVGFFVILSLWGLVALLTNSFKLPSGSNSWSIFPNSATCASSGSTFTPTPTPSAPTNAFTGTPTPTPNTVSPFQSTLTPVSRQTMSP